MVEEVCACLAGKDILIPLGPRPLRFRPLTATHLCLNSLTSLLYFSGLCRHVNVIPTARFSARGCGSFSYFLFPFFDTTPIRTGRKPVRLSDELPFFSPCFDSCA